MRFDPDCPWRHGCRPHDVAYRVSPIHHRERSAENRLARKVERLFADRRVCIAAIIPGLDATQKQVITVLKTTPEHWHSRVDPCSPLKAYVSVPAAMPWAKLCASSHAEWNPPKQRPPALQK